MMADAEERGFGAPRLDAHNPATGKVAASSKAAEAPVSFGSDSAAQQDTEQQQQQSSANTHDIDVNSQPTPTRVSSKKKKTKKKLKGAAGSTATKSKKNAMSANLANTNYEMVRQVCRELGFKVKASPTSMDCNLLWFDCCPPGDVFSKLLPYQRMNHFPGTGQITRKDNLARNLNRLLRACGSDTLNIFPRSWVLPADLQHFRNYIDDCKKGKGKGKSGKRKRRTFIYKPINGARGVGISVTQNPAQIPTHESLLVQEYLPRPFLVEGYKFDLRLYVLLTSCDPLRIYLFKDGLVRLSTTPYKAPTKKNVADVTMHLTNYSLNKGADGFQKTDEDDTGSKRTYQWLLQHLRDEHGADTDRLQRRIADVITKTVIVSLPFVRQGYAACQLHQARDKQGRATLGQSMCFEILGFDILLTSKLKPYIIEVNRAPSFACDSQLDARIKHDALHSALRMLHIRTKERTRWQQRAKESAMRRLHAHTQPSATQQRDDSSAPSLATRASTHSMCDDYGSEDVFQSNTSSSTTVAANMGPQQQKQGRKRQQQQQQQYALAGRSQEQDEAESVSGEDNSDNSDNEQGDQAASDLDDDDTESCTSGSKVAVEKAARQQMMFEDTNKGDYDRIFPVENETLMLQYQALIATSCKVVQASVGTARGRQPQQLARGHVRHTAPAPASTTSPHIKSSSPRPSARTPASGTCTSRNSMYAARGRSSARGPTPPASCGASSSSSSSSWIARSPAFPRAAAPASTATYDRAGVVDEGLTRLLHHLSLNGAAAIGIDTFEDDVVEHAAEVEDEFVTHRTRMARFWLRTLPPSERHRTLAMCRQRILDTASSVTGGTLIPRATRVVARVFDRLAFSHGQGLWNSFTLPSCSWQAIEPLMAVVSPTDQEKMLCSRLVFLAKQLLLCLYARHDLSFSKSDDAACQADIYANSAVVEPNSSDISTLAHKPQHPPRLQQGDNPEQQLRRPSNRIGEHQLSPSARIGGGVFGKAVVDGRPASPRLDRRLARGIASPYRQRSMGRRHQETGPHHKSASPVCLQPLIPLPVQTISFDRGVAALKK